MITPLYKKLKTNGTTIYVFPGAAEDFNAATYNDNIKMNFSKFALLRLPRQNTVSTLKKIFSFEDAFDQINISTPPSTSPYIFADSLIESLRNYVANEEASLRSSKISSTEYLYDPQEARTVTERIFWKWLRKLNVLDLEVAKPSEDWNPDLADFANPTTGDTYFNEYLWRERVVKDYNITSASWATNVLTVVLDITTNFKPNDVVNITIPEAAGLYKIVTVVTTNVRNDTITVALNSDPGTMTTTNKTVTLQYDRVVQYVGEIVGTNNVQKPDGTFTEVYAHVHAQNGQTPVVLFESIVDNNYRPTMSFPIISSQLQPEIRGAENPQSPIITNPTTYPGDWWGHFDTTEYTYETSTGDYLRRQGDFFGVLTAQQSLLTAGDPAYPDFSGNNLDGISIDFDIKHYLKSQSNTPPNTNFDEFNGTTFNNTAPSDFEFNAILWYYEMTDTTTNVTVNNLYGISFLDNPANDPESTFDFIPVLKKLVPNGTQDGTAYIFNLVFNFDVESETTPAAFDPNKVYDLFEFDLYNEAVRRLALINDKYSDALTQVSQMRSDINDLRSLIYTQKQLESITTRMDSLESLLKLYSTLQIGNSDSISATIDNSTNPPSVKLNSTDKQYSQILKINTSDLFANQESAGLTIVLSEPKIVSFSSGKSFAVIVNNNDNDNNQNVTYDPNTPIPVLEIILEKDLDYKQQVEFFILPDNGVNDKHLEILVNYNDTTAITPQLLAGPLALPVDRYTKAVDGTTLEPINKWAAHPKFNPLQVSLCKINASVRTIVMDFEGDLTDIEAGSRVMLNDFIVQNPSDATVSYNLSGVFTVYSSPTYIPGGIESVSIVNQGTNISSGSGNYTYTSPLTGDSKKDAIFYLTISGNLLTNVDVLHPGYGFTPNTANLLKEITTLTATANPFIQVFPQIKTRIHFTLDSANIIHQALIDAFDPFVVYGSTAFENTANNYRLPLKPYLENYPYMDFNRGYKVIITRISETDTIPPTNYLDRYRVEIDRL